MCQQGVLRLLVVMAILLPETSLGRVISVRQDGTGDYTTVTAAVAAAGANDSIAVGPGTYAEAASFSIAIPLTLFSTNGRDVTILDGGNAHRILVATSPGIKLVGLSFVNGLGEGGPPTAAGATYLLSRSQVTMEDCLFRNHHGAWGGAIYCTDSSLGNNTRLDALRCVFDSNVSTSTAGAVYLVNGAVGTFTDCTFLHNSTGVKAGAVHVIRASATFQNCFFQGNQSGDIAGAIFFESSAGAVQSCTFYDHTSPGAVAGTIVIQLSAGTNISRNIFDGETAGYGLRYYQGTDAHSCNVFWDNAAGAIGLDQLAADDVVADPRFCDAAAGNFTISDNSPAAPAQSACGQLIGNFPVACHLPGTSGSPVIASIYDVPNDDGRQVRIRWNRSPYDARSQPFVITEYGVYRRQPANSMARATAPAAKAGRRPGIDLDGWDFVTSVPARGDDIYQVVAPTLCDAPNGGDICWSVFFVSAMTPDPLSFFDSDPDSGYSTDDLPPGKPGMLSAMPAGSGMEIRWGASSGDVAQYRIYRGQGDFQLSESALVGTSIENRWLDSSPAASGPSYKVTAVDEVGNESAPAVLQGNWRPPSRFALHQAEPNPFNPETVVYYDVAEGGGHVSLRIYDVRGRLVRTLVDRVESPGWRKSVAWGGANDDGRQVPAGVYFCRLQAQGYDRSLRIVLIE